MGGTTPRSDELLADDASAKSSACDNDFWIFRDGRQTLPGTKLLEELRASICALSNPGSNSTDLLNALIRAGELEAGLADAGSSTSAAVAKLADGLAGVLYGEPLDYAKVSFPANVSAAQQVEISPPEGFSYYALHPSDFGRLALVVHTSKKPAAIIGIRSIGTTLSAIARAALASAGIPAARITVRPTGHPYQRKLRFTTSETAWIKEQKSLDAMFLVVDEGPGRSGSTFLSVAEALLAAGVDHQRITLLGSRQPDLNQLCAEDGARRWNMFRFEAVDPDTHSRFQKYTYIGGGEWRKFFIRDVGLWPVCWPQMERLKFISPDRHCFWKFEGMGRLGDQAQTCNRILSAAGFGIMPEDGGAGFASYPIIAGETLHRKHLSRFLLERFLHYLAVRMVEFRVSGVRANPLSQMLTFNVQHEFGVEIRLHDLESSTCILTDGRMQPHEWIGTAEGTILKTDACTHGNDHFFPGPCDIAWDLAGMAVEWELDSGEIDTALLLFHQLTGDLVTPRFPAYALAYSVFRMGCCRMALSTVNTNEAFRLRAAAVSYRKHAAHWLRRVRNSLGRTRLAS
ncbi:MAG TPA: hypothetical protein VH437_08530 [Terriglobales bacterium]|jgi:hypothetical protein